MQLYSVGDKIPPFRTCAEFICHFCPYGARKIAPVQVEQEVAVAIGQEGRVFRRGSNGAQVIHILCKGPVAAATLSHKRAIHGPRVDWNSRSSPCISFSFFYFFNFFATALTFDVPQEWIIGLREGHTLEEHLALIGKPINIKQYIPEIHGYAIPTSQDDDSILSSICEDRQVGFIVQKPRGFFSKDAHIGLSGDDLDEYEDERRWLTLQDQDPEVIVTDDGAT